MEIKNRTALWALWAITLSPPSSVIMEKLQAQSFNAAWISATSGQWTEVFRWNTFGFLPYPDNDQTDTYNVLIAMGASPTITLNTDVTLSSLDLASGYIQGSNHLSALESFIWRGGGLIGGQGTLTAHKQLRLEGAKKFFRNFQVTNEQEAVWSSGDMIAGADARWLNQSKALFKITHDGRWLLETNQTYSAILNKGTIRKEASAGTLLMQALLDNSGTIELESGTWQLDGPVQNKGSILGANDTTLHISKTYLDQPLAVIATEGHLRFSGTTESSSVQGNFEGGATTTLECKEIQFLPSSTLIALGERVLIQKGKVALNSRETIQMLNLTLTDQGMVTGSDSIEIVDQFLWDTGTQLAGEKTHISQTFTEWYASSHPDKPRILSEGSLINKGNLLWSQGNTLLRGGATLSNSAEALFSDHQHGTISEQQGNSANMISNAGKWVKDFPGGWSIIEPAFYNQGHVHLNQGHVHWKGHVENSGEIRTEQGQSVRFSKGYASTAGSTLVSGGWITFDNEETSIEYQGRYAALDGSQINGPDMVFSRDATVESFGEILRLSKGSLTLNTGVAQHMKQFNLSQNASLNTHDEVIIHQQSSWESGSIVQGEGSVKNMGSLQLSIPAGAEGQRGQLALHEFINQGEVRWISGNWDMGPEMLIHNENSAKWLIEGNVSSSSDNPSSGPVFVNQGILQFTVDRGKSALNWRLLHQGELHIEKSLLTLSNPMNVSDGEIRLREGKLQSPTITFTDAVLNGTGAISGELLFMGNNKLILGDEALTLDGLIALDLQGSLELSLANKDTGIHIPQSVTLGGTLVIEWNGAEPLSFGTVIHPLQMSRYQGRFESIIGEKFPEGVHLRPFYHENGLSLFVLDRAADNQHGIELVTLYGKLYLFPKAASSHAVVQFCDDLANPVWKDYASFKNDVIEWDTANTPFRFFRIKP